MVNIKDELKVIKKRNAILKQFETIAEQKGFIKVESDYFEPYDAFTALNQRQNVNDLVKVQDLRGNLYLLQPDITSNIIKQVIPRIDKDMALELYYSDNIFYYSGSGEITTKRQFGVEVIGKKEIRDDIKMISFIDELFKTYKIETTIEIGNQAFINIIIDQLDLSQIMANQVKQYLITKNQKELETVLKGVENVAYVNLLVDCINKQNQLDDIKKSILTNNLDKRLIKEINKLETIQTSINNKNVWYDLSTINQYDYYNGPIYKAYIKGYKKEVLSGGRYDYLTVELGSPTRALGFSLDMDIFIKEVINRG